MKRKENLFKLRHQCSSNKIKIPIYNLAEEEVQKLNIDSNILSPINLDDDKEIKLEIKNKMNPKITSKLFKYFESKEKLQNSQINISTNSTNGYNEINEEDLTLNNNLSTSIQKLKVLIPDINKKMANNQSVVINIPKKDYKVESNEIYLNAVLTELNQKVMKIKNKKTQMENELNNIEKEINDKQLYIELSKNDNFQRNIKLKIINKFEKEYNENKNKEMLLNDLNNSKTNSIDKEDLFSVKNKYKDENEIKKQKISESKKPIEKKNAFDELKERAFKTKLNNAILTNQILTKQKSDKFTKDIINQKEQKKEIWEKIKIYQEKLKKLHSVKNKIKDSLYMYYLSILKEGRDTRDEGLAWVIAEILNLGKKVLISHIPKYLDEKSILYLFIKAHLILKIKYIEKQINDLNSNDNEKKEKKKRSSRDSLKLKAMNTLNNIKEKFIYNKYENNNKKMSPIENEKNGLNLNPISISKYKASSLLLKKSDKKLPKSNSMIIYKHRNNYLNREKENEILNYIKLNEKKKLLLKGNKKISFEKYIALNEKMQKLKKLKETLKEKEMERIFEEFRLKKYFNKYNIDKKVVLSALIGEQNIAKECSIQDKKEKLLKEERGKTRLYMNNYLINKSMLMNGGSWLLNKI